MGPTSSDVNKDWRLKAMARTKDLTFKAKSLHFNLADFDMSKLCSSLAEQRRYRQQSHTRLYTIPDN